MTATYQPNRSPYQPPYQPVGPGSYAPATDNTSMFDQFGFKLLLFFLFLAFSRIFDVKFGGLHLPGITSRLMFAMVLFNGSFVPALGTKIGKAFLGFTLFFALSVPFSIWKGGSLPIFRDTWLLFCFPSFLAVAGLVSSYSRWYKTVKTVAIALFVFTIVANVFGVMIGGRLFLEQGKFSNPNEMGQALLLGVPLWAGMMGSTDSPLKKMRGAMVILLMLVTTFRTGSRGTMIAIAVTLFVYFLRASIMGKMKILMGGIVIVGLLLGFAPGRLIARYKTAVDEEADDAGAMDSVMRESAITSTQSRKQLLKKSLIFTMQHPLFGVGPGMFEEADDIYSKAAGMRKGQWQGTHNSYTQVSSELGIPAFLFYLTAVVLSLKGPYAVYKKTRGDPRLAGIGSMALGLHYCMIVFAVTIFFDYIAYTMLLSVLGGLAAALVRTADAEIERLKAVPPPVTMSPTMFHEYLGSRAGRMQPSV